MRNLSPSQIQTFKQCKRKWYLHYVMELPTSTSYEQGIGKIIHDCLDIYHGRKGNPIPRITDDCNITADDKDLMTNMMYNYMKYDEKNPLTEGYDEILTECDIEDTVFGHKGVNLHGRMDILMLNHKDRRATIVEHKTSDRDYTLNKFYLHYQTKLYQMMVSHKLDGWKVDVMFNILYKRYPKEPKLNANGTMSRAKCITTKRMVLDFLLKHGLARADYKDYIEAIPNYVFIERFPVVEFKSKFTRLITTEIIDDINRAYSSFYPYGEEGPLCDTCSYIDICVLGDDPLLLQPYLVKKEV
jgi:CRISPR/Cas system-associated exonuclease Cas4 (RecB family)